MGYAERLDNGNTAISWGWANITYTEVDPHGNTVLEFKLDPGIISYRVAKYPDDDYGQVTSSAAKQEEQFVSNYPNPFNPATKISFRLKSAGNVSLTVYDAMGREVRNLIEDKLMSAGDHEADFNASDLSSGIYFYTLRTGNEFTTRKMIYLK
ncbi:MAG: T9SS type A sorting domain-containing protein [Ignavibacteriaceae bacterium]|nr:T9SS type A sorting domain-containing protein [Ignavibacteriaceae bacterium]